MLRTTIDKFHNWYLQEQHSHWVSWLRIVTILGYFYIRIPKIVEMSRSIVGQESFPHYLPTWHGAIFPPLYELPSEFIVVLPIVTIIAATCALVGLQTRLSLLTLFIVSCYVFPYRMAWAKPGAAYGFDIVVLAVLMVAPGVTSLSLDRVIRSYFKRFRSTDYSFSIKKVLKPPRVSLWPIKLILMLFIFQYFIAGVAKFRYGETGWIDGKTLAFYISPANREPFKRISGQARVNDQMAWKGPYELMAPVHASHARHPLLYAPQWVYENRFLMIFFGFGSVIFELLAPLVFFWPRFGLFFFHGASVFHILVYLWIGPRFPTWMILDLFFLYYYYQLVYSVDLTRTKSPSPAKPFNLLKRKPLQG